MLELLDLRIHAHLLGSVSTYSFPVREFDYERGPGSASPFADYSRSAVPSTHAADHPPRSTEAVVSLRPRILRVPKVELSLSQARSSLFLAVELARDASLTASLA